MKTVNNLIQIRETSGNTKSKNLKFRDEFKFCEILNNFNIRFRLVFYSSDMETFIRKEMKYMITDQQKQQLLELLQSDIEPDFYFDCTIYSIYFDTEQLDLLRHCEGKPGLKQKVRLRSYKPAYDAATPVFLELKKKAAGTSFKTRHEFTLPTLKAFLNSGQAADQATRELSSMLSRYELHPQFVLCAHRNCYQWKGREDLRITIDDRLTYRSENLGLYPEDEDESILEKGMNILEVKCAQNVPLKLARALNTLQIKPASTSKASLAYARLLETKNQDAKKQMDSNAQPIHSLPLERPVLKRVHKPRAVQSGSAVSGALSA